MLIGFVKLYSSLLGSSLWRADHPTRIVWITLLLLADPAGDVDTSLPGLAHFANVSPEEAERAITFLCEPDGHSRSTDHDGRRIAATATGWRILNFESYRARRTDRRTYERQKKVEYRKKAQKAKGVAPPRAITRSAVDLQALWNDLTALPLPRCQELSKGRRTQIAARLKEHPEADYWRDVIARIAASEFCRGRNDRAWVATFDWLIKPETCIKVLEGKYDDRPDVPTRTPRSKEEKNLAAARRTVQRWEKEGIIP